MRNKKRSFIVVFFATVLLSAVFWVGSVWQRIYYSPAAAEEPAPLPAQEENIVNVMILGLDGDGGRGRADTVMIVSINENTGQLAVISVPRDARVNIPGRGPGKLNHAMTGKGEIALIKQTLEQLFGVPVHHYISTDLDGFVNIINLLGGVTIDVEKRMVHSSVNRPSIDLYPGVQLLDGRQALAYVRYRGDAAGDFGRMQRQQKFLKAVAAEVLQVQSLFKLPQLLEEAARYVRTDLSLAKILAFGRFALSLDLAAVESVTLQGRGVTIGGVSYVALDEAQLGDTVRRYLRWEKEEAPSPKQNPEAGT